MASLVDELQEAAQNPNVSISDLLRKAKVAASKLEQPELFEWADKELKGYRGSDVPPYRTVSGNLQAFDPMAGWRPIILDDPKLSESLLQGRKMGFSIPQVEEFLRTSTGDLFLPTPFEFAAPFMRKHGVSDVAFTVSRSTMSGILAAVRDAILDWSLRLERAGIRGEAMSFTKEEKQKAHSAGTTIHIEKIEGFAGNISGEISGNAFITASQSSAMNLDLTQVKALAQQIREQVQALPQEYVKPVGGELESIDSELSKSSPDQSRIRSALASIRSVLEGAGGNLLAMGIGAAISQVLR